MQGAGLAGHGVGSPKSSSPLLAPRRKTKPVQVSAESVNTVITRVAEEGEHLGELGCVAGSRVMPGMAVGSVRWWRVQFRRAG